ncbi:PREDICTED: ras-related protein Rab-28-like [Amphimedon queenslandica]|uniref:Ras-related protein Rab-28 n=1 Tax=Amphimedon queenslandica TaxID=400682 RepID=A0A1X7VII6_AMPQE|nr:PREDICTED: ras-related protein Rab-28-like [Amphimedon queenslandica]|eukprot:XP_003384288.1 PREDICTED: ras-related protein Rab-28-like [Amphimedon queenslandica]
MAASSEAGQQIKIVLLGDGTTGKTSLATRISQNNFTKKYDQTLGVDFYLRRLELPGAVQVTLQVWDIGGQTVGGKMLENYIYGANAVLLIYDITNYSSFDNLEEWLKETKKVFANSDRPLPYMMLVANKIDLEHQRTVKREKHLEFAKAHRITSHSLSAKNDDLVYQCFLKAAAGVLKISLTSADLDTSQKVIKADIETEKPASEGATVLLPTKKTVSKNKSVICSLQ